MANEIVYCIQRFSWVLVALVLVFGWVSPILMILSIVCMFGPIIFSFSFGRAWCGNFCPRGSLSGEILPIISPNKPIPRLLKSSIFRIVMFILLIMFFINNIAHSNGTLLGIGMAFIKMMVITTIMQVCFAVLIHPYAWCSFCPMGTVASFITRAKKDNIDNIIIGGNCMECNVCKNNCPLQIDIPGWISAGEVKDPDCMKCRKCIKTCSCKCLKYE
ncbi:MAG: 4Fe-4S binding protein [Clostridia bacterium]|nr:4Fe-4S binding protein [Clostridia bacterium]